MGGRPLEAFVTVANPTLDPMELLVRLSFAPSGTRTQRATVAAGETWGIKIRSLFGSRASDPLTTMTGLTVTCNAGTTACPVSVSVLAPPACLP